MMTPIKEKNVGLCILFSILTCGIYGIFWFIDMTNDMGRVSGEAEWTGGKAFLFTLLTCGIYSFYWAYKMGKLSAVALSKNGLPAEDRAVLYLVLSVLGLGIVNYIFIQLDLNKLATPTNPTQPMM